MAIERLAVEAVPDQPIIPAATLVLFRESGGAAPELLMMERTGNMAFAAGAMVFPGGRIDPQDHEVAASALVSGAFDDAAGRVAAIRETLEESGLAIAMPPGDEPAMRAALARDEPFGEVLARHGKTIDLGAIVPFARWCPNFRESRTFDTRFYLARAPIHDIAISIDPREHVHLLWTSAAAMLAAADAGEAHIIFPTRRNLERLAQFADFDEAVAHAAAHPVETITPWIEQRDGIAHLCIPEGLGYPVTAEAFERVRRG